MSAWLFRFFLQAIESATAVCTYFYKIMYIAHQACETNVDVSNYMSAGFFFLFFFVQGCSNFQKYITANTVFETDLGEI